MTKSESIKELATALSKAQSEMHGAKKDSVNPFFKSNYADLASCWDACRLPLTKNGLSIIQTTRVTENGGTILVTTILHNSGEFISGEIPVKPMKDDIQGMGAALTYYRRFALMGIVSLTAEDDDGESAMNRSPGVTRAPTPQTVRATNPAKPGTVLAR